MKVRSVLTAALIANVLAFPAYGSQMLGKVGVAYTLESKDIVETAMGSAQHETLVAAVKAAGLVETLQGEGPFTVFAPTDAAFSQLPAGTVETLLQPKNRDQLASILTYHVVPGRIDAQILANAIKSNGGEVTYSTVQSDELTFRIEGKELVVEDAKGKTAVVAAANVFSSNGVIHVIDGVLLPN